MKLLIDTHTHTVESGHAYSTLRENAIFAFQQGLEAFVTSDHGPKVPASAPAFLIPILADVPDIIEGVRLVRGAEINILDADGGLDIAEKYLKYTEYAIASLHDVTFRSGDIAHNTAALIGALRNPYVDVIGHPGNPQFPVDIESIVKEAKAQGKLIEVNNHSFGIRKGCEENCARFVHLCKQHDVRIAVASDAHSCYNVGIFTKAIELLESCGFPEEMVVSRDWNSFSAYLDERKRRLA